MKKSLIAALLALSSFTMVAEGRANDGVLTTTRIEVPYSDLNLNHPAGAAAMLGRIKAAAVRACGGAPDALDMAGRKAFRDCVTVATNDAVRQLNAPLVTALHTGRISDPRVAGR